MKAVNLNTLAFYLSRPHACNYFPEREAIMLVADPDAAVDGDMYSELIQFGFRRSGQLVYRPRCENCRDCLPSRIPVADFRASRSQRRAWKANRDLRCTAYRGRPTDEHFELYQRYINGRHPACGMDDFDSEHFENFLLSPNIETVFYEFRLDGRLLAVAVADMLKQGVSAVYTFFDPMESRRGLGVYTILWQIEAARELELPFVFLGYWLKECAKMSYKSRYRPLEVLRDGGWQVISDDYDS